MLGPIEDHRTIGDTIREILVVTVASVMVAAALLIWLVGGVNKITAFNPEAIQTQTWEE